MARFSRPEIFDEISTEPQFQLATRFGVSDVALNKTCVKAGLPMPSRGYWARKEAGLKVLEQPPIPARGLGRSNWIQIGNRYERDNFNDPLTPEPSAPSFETSLDEVQNLVSRIAARVRLRKSLSYPPPLIAELLAQDERRKLMAEPHGRRYGCGIKVQVRDKWSSYHRNDEPHLEPTEKAPLSIYCAKEIGEDLPIAGIDSPSSRFEDQLIGIVPAALVLGEVIHREDEEWSYNRTTKRR